MKRVICLYRVSTLGQVDHDDIPMQKLACREYAATHPDWEIVDEISEKGVSGYKISTNARDAIVEIKKRAVLHQFDVLLVFIRALIDNPIYIGVYHMEGVQSEPLEQFRIIDDAMFERCQQTVKGRSTINFGRETPVPVRTSSRCLLPGILYCAECGCRMTFTHNATRHKLADGTIKVYERDMYRCYRKISSKRTCTGQSSYDMRLIDPAVEAEVRRFLVQIGARPREELQSIASARNTEMYQIAYNQAEKEFENAQKQVTALEEEVVKALTGESQLDLSVVNTMLLKYRSKLETAHQAMSDAQVKLETESQSAKETKAQIDELLSWADCFDRANTETKHMIMARLIDRVELATDYKIHIRFKISLDQFLGKATA